MGEGRTGGKLTGRSKLRSVVPLRAGEESVPMGGGGSH